jgi:hypothetical protein
VSSRNSVRLRYTLHLGASPAGGGGRVLRFATLAQAERAMISWRKDHPHEPAYIKESK